MRAVSTLKRRIDVSTDSRYLTIGQVRERFGVSDMWVWRQLVGAAAIGHYPMTDDSSAKFQSLALALDYLERHPDRFLFPIKAGAKSPPLISENLTKASNDRKQITAWSQQWPGCNWGLALKLSRLLVVDVAER